MKILILIPSLAAIYGGTSITAPALAAALGRRGWSVDLVTTDADGLSVLDVPRGNWIKQDGYRVRYFARLGQKEFKPSPAMLFWMLQHVTAYDVVLINSDFNFPVLAGTLACRWHGVPYLLTPHGMLEPWALGHKARKKRAYYSWIERPLVLRGATMIQALNTAEAANIGALQLGPPIITLPNGIDPREIQPGESDKEAFFAKFPQTRGKTLLLFLHRIDPKKGLDLLAYAFALVRTRFPQAHVVVAGPDNVNFTKTAKGFFEQAGCGGTEGVTFTGMLDGILKRGALAAAAIFVAPSYSEGFSMSVLEAMAAGLPCVITTGCNFPEASEANAAKVVPIDADAFSSALIGLLSEPSAGRAMGLRARDLVLQNYTWDKVAARFEELTKDLFPSPASCR